MIRKWWKEAVAYQIYPRSFMDSNGDGIGDIQGIIQKLNYLSDLGIDVIWICPIYQSPNDDNGYDISDYQKVLSEFGTMEDFDQLLREVHRRGMKLIMDLVLNHTSDEHPWFIESKSSARNPYRDYYIWRSSEDGAEPNNWESIFGGSAWQYDEKTNEYYLHVFSAKQPDLNWENEAVRNDLYKIVNWWLDKGIDGFRIDAISHIKKEPGLPNMPNPDQKRYVPSFAGHMNRPGIEYFLQEFVDHTINHYDVMTVAEANGVSVEQAEQWVGETDGYFDMIFQFEHLGLWKFSDTGGLDIHSLKQTLSKWQYTLDQVGWNALFLENHDQPRSVSTWGDDGAYWEASAKSLATMFFFMQGTPFIYQGQEIGMTNVQFDSIDDYNDVAIRNKYHQERSEGRSHEEIMQEIWKNGRDNSRTPMQWNDNIQAGFSHATPWMKVNPNFRRVNVDEQIQRTDSIYHYYKAMIRLRKMHDVFVYGSYQLIEEAHDFVYAYTRTLGRKGAIIISNMFAQSTSITLPENLQTKELKLVLSNYSEEQNTRHPISLHPYEARVYVWEE
ncbi:alpha amylase catalytic subunit [Gracilibacillus halophilus YIM-C55.5]|uniref:Alpha-amylase n=1 Tax=Gracilibacillus halophilus YIM-C55.5 TaxID=1308866 RepID=N4WMC6_9BACI|nr:alpha-glucosidase [Gracilibacillus halophilus]ENH95665.1 alpha amylase catalytic subunit [Gracilibacillus halophilus YIM-C55.5]